MNIHRILETIRRLNQYIYKLNWRFFPRTQKDDKKFIC